LRKYCGGFAEFWGAISGAWWHLGHGRKRGKGEEREGIL
jgi:hypothetical protein